MGLREQLGGMTSTAIWQVERHFNFIFEIETDKVAHLVPAPLSLREPRPGVSLVNVGYMKYPPGELGGQLPAFEEITFSLLVNPDLSLDAPIPRLCVYDFRIGSDSAQFLAFERDHQKLNGYLAEGLVTRFDVEHNHLSVADKHGPIFELRNTLPAPHWKTEVAVGQYYSRFGNELWQGVFLWDGRGCEHQHAGDAGRLYPHPFFAEIDVRDVGDCYMQMCLAPRTGVVFGSYHPRKLRTLDEARR
jgi:hypothetical protein